jgi:drug/metabolite transporter (DMT)-like permease
MPPIISRRSITVQEFGPSENHHAIGARSVDFIAANALSVPSTHSEPFPMPPLTLRRAPVKGLLYMLAAVLAFSAMDAAAKWLTAGYSVVEVAVLSRAISPFLALAIAMQQGGLHTLKTRRPGWHLFRSAANGLTLLTFFGALIFLPLADTVAITFVSPLIMCALAVPMLKERVGPRRWAAIVVGFLGVLVITQPSGAGFGWGAVLALAAAFCDALGINITRRMSVTETSHSQLFWSSIVLIAAFGTMLLFHWPSAWVTPSAHDLLPFAILSISGCGAQFCLAQAFRYGEVSLLAPLQYGALIWAVIFGYVFWGDLPTLTVLGGVAILIASSAYIAHREARAKGVAAVAERDLIERR